MELEKIINFLNFATFYYFVLLVRCALVSYVVFAVAITLRKTVLKSNVFLKGAVWALFIPVLFTAKMKIFDESRAGMIFSNCLRIIGKYHAWICWLYICGAFLYAALLIRKRRKVQKLVTGMEKRKVDDAVIYVTTIPVTPFTAGVFRPKIVMPEVILKEYDREEFQTILFHENIHIRMGHLLFYLLWDVLRVLLWINPLLTIGTRYFREDMEEICDWVTIRESQGKAYTYGQLLLKSMKVLQEESENFNMYAAFVGDKDYRDIRQRVTKIAGYKPYKRNMAVGTLIAVMFCVTGFIFGIKAMSYDRNIESVYVMIYGYENGDVTFTDYSDELYQMISYDDSYVYVNSEEFDSFLHKSNADGDIYIVFGGFQKLPGIGGSGYSCLYENDAEEKIVQIPYDNLKDNWVVILSKML